ncbi:MAG: hypothetical protein JSS61_06040 [Verrucomicrobia bacterium]|nr:hypothetical protein [Verrucomicrobiota bacterium]
MFKSMRGKLLFPLSPQVKLKKKILIATAIILFSCFFLGDVAVARMGHFEPPVLIFFKNIHLLIPWGIAYLAVVGYRDLLKAFAPLYLSLAMLVATCSQVFFDQAKGQNETLCTSPVNQSQYDFFNKLFWQQDAAISEALRVIDLENVLEYNVVSNLANINSRKNQLEGFSYFLEACYRRMEGIHLDYVLWAIASPDNNEVSRKGFAEAYFLTAEDNRLFRMEPYRIKIDIINENIASLDFLSKIYGTYEVDADGQISFSRAEDHEVWNALFAKISNLFAEEKRYLNSIRELENSIAQNTGP